MSKTILMIHGFGAAGESWAPVAAHFQAAGYAVEHPTLHAAYRTVGPPPASLAGKTLADYVTEMSDLAKAIAQRDGEKPVVFGHSMGGLISQKLAEAGLVSGLVLFSPASPADARGKPKLSPVFTFLNIAVTSKPETKAVKIWKTGFKWGVLNQTPAARHDAIFAATVHDSGRALSDLAYPDRDPNRTVHIDASKVTAPVLVLGGARDRTTPIDDIRLVAKKYGAPLKEYPDNAHWLIDEPGSARILAEVQTWLDEAGLGVKTPAVAKAPAAKAEAAAKAAPAAKAARTVEKPVEEFGPGTKGPKPSAAKPAPEAITPEPKGPKTPAKAAAPKAAPQPAAKVTTAAPAKAKAPAKTAAPKAAPAPKIAQAAEKPVAKLGPGTKGPSVSKAPAPKAKAAAPAKPPAKAAEAPKVAKAAPTPKPAAKPGPATKAVAPPKAAPKAKVVPAPKPKAVAKPVAAKAPAPAKAPGKAAAAPKAAPTAVKAPATKSTAKSSPSPKKSV